LVAAILIGACDKGGSSAPQKPPTSQASEQTTATSAPTSAPEGPPVPGRYVNEENRFSVDFPRSWKLQTDPEGLFVIQATSPQENSRDAFAENVYIMVRDLPKPYSLNDYFDLSRVNFPRISNDAVQQAIGQIMVNEQICPWVIFTHTINDVACKSIRYYLRHGQKVFIIVCTSTPEAFDKYRQTFEDIVNSIDLEL